MPEAYCHTERDEIGQVDTAGKNVASGGVDTCQYWEIVD